MKPLLLPLLALLLLWNCQGEPQKQDASQTTEEQAKTAAQTDSIPFLWEGANVYFLLTDRFRNGKPENDVNFNRTLPTGPLRGFMGGDLAGIIDKIEAGYFDRLGVNAIWFTPVVEQIHGATDEGTGLSYGYHGYWAKDWTALDPNFGTRAELERLVETAHSHGIRVLMDVVLNHTGPVTDQDAAWPKDWVRQEPVCTFDSYENTTACTLVENLPDIYTESDAPVELPDALLAKWKAEGRLSLELDELQVFFERTGYPRAPRFYLIKWLTDYVNDLGIDGFRVDTAKHADEKAWGELYKQASFAFENWKKLHPDRILDQNPFFMVGEVYGYGISGGRDYDFGNRKVDYFDHGFKALINFELKMDAANPYEETFRKYNRLLQNPLNGKSVMNYLSSHDDGNPFDPDRVQPYRAANVLLLTPGISQIYYGDETSRPLRAEGAVGDANLRTFMNWGDLDSLETTQNILDHWQKLGRFRRMHPAVGAGRHHRLSSSPYVFSRSYTGEGFRDKVVIGLDLKEGKKSLLVRGFFGDGTALRDAYSGQELVVRNGRAEFESPFAVALLELKP
ncbi:alpha-amylase family glycosyl hydrolase [Robiginitalea sp. M366]|uniref:alpha-amylase family glycosyl hydrolase n=1 Tax=Robiginitalea aestuariiviva TaxID=3036903 RepID=UPI00240CE904|nr:alpha-amylase family glycosyl hydrolase [Robiginitalea aestuariiviva]MDG1573506.1 alpha-amylase family glycosyl hydrolase [Robiginitalea aestuariiviva]